MLLKTRVNFYLSSKQYNVISINKILHLLIINKYIKHV